MTGRWPNTGWPGLQLGSLDPHCRLLSSLCCSTAHGQAVTTPPAFLKSCPDDWQGQGKNTMWGAMSYFFIQLGGGNQGSNLSELGGNPVIKVASQRQFLVTEFLDFSLPVCISKCFFPLALKLSKTSQFPWDVSQFDYLFFPGLEAAMP